MLRRCVNCLHNIPVGDAVVFDANHNVLCPYCNGPLMPTTLEGANELKPKIGLNQTGSTSVTRRSHSGYVPGSTYYEGFCD